MAGTRKIRIPEEEKIVLHSLREMPIGQFDELYDRIKDANPTLALEDFINKIKSAIDNPILKDQAPKITELAVQAARAGFFQGINIDEVLNALVEIAKENSSSKFSDDDWAELHRRLSMLVSLDAVELTASSGLYLTAHPYIYRSARFFADTRLLFVRPKDGIPSEPKASVLIHQLQIRTTHNQQEEDFFIALDDDDLLQMKDAVEEAIRNSGILQSIEKTAGRLVIAN